MLSTSRVRLRVGFTHMTPLHLQRLPSHRKSIKARDYIFPKRLPRGGRRQLIQEVEQSKGEVHPDKDAPVQGKIEMS